MNALHSANFVVVDAQVTHFLQRLVSLIPSEAEPHAVGGFLRDALLGRPSYDIDLTVCGDVIPLAHRLAKELDGVFVPLDEERHIARVVVCQEDAPLHIDLASLRGDRLHDLSQRDFTVNAMSVPLPALLQSDWPSSVIDPFGGRRDLEQRVLRMVNEAVFHADGLRLLRAVRLDASLGFQIEQATKEAIRKSAVALTLVSSERIRDELLAILSNRGALEHVYLLDELGLLCLVVPELEQGRNVTQPKEHYWDVFRHNIEAVGAIEGLLLRRYEPSWVLDYVPWNEDLAAYFGEMVGEGHTRATLLKLACLLHDIAKPATRTVEESGRIRFFGHHSEGAAMVRGILERLRMSRRTTKAIETMVEYHLRPGQMSQGAELATQRAIYRYFRSAGDVAVDTLYLNLADYLAARGALLQRDEWESYAARVRHIFETGKLQKKEFALPKLIDGHRLMSALELAPGPTVGRLLEAIGEAQATGEITTEEEALAIAKEILAAHPEAQNA